VFGLGSAHLNGSSLNVDSKKQIYKMKSLDGISLNSKISLAVAGLIMMTFFTVQTCIVFGLCEPTLFLAKFGWGCVVFFMPPFFKVVSEFLYKKKKVTEELDKQIHSFKRFEDFVQEATIVTKADSRAKITYVNEKFEEVSGWKFEEVKGRDHVIVNSGTQPKKYWKGMYDTVHQGKIWHDVVTNKRKDGSFYYVDTYIKANFDNDGNVIEYVSVRQDLTDIIKATDELAQKNVYLEHAAKIIRHDMHSGINTYLPRGIKSLKRRITDDQINELKIQAPLQLISDGLTHAQKVYAGVYEFTNLVKQNAHMSKAKVDIKYILEDYLRLTAYKNQVILDDNLPKSLEVNEPLFCTAIDNLIRNGLKYNDSPTKWVKIYQEGSYNSARYIIIEDNGRGLSQTEFIELSKPYTRKEGQKESGTGLGLNICIEILKEHGFDIKAEKLEQGTKLKIRIDND